MAASLPDDFQARGLIADASEGWGEHLATGSRTCYVGFDPTADSLHVGSLLKYFRFSTLTEIADLECRSAARTGEA